MRQSFPTRIKRGSHRIFIVEPRAKDKSIHQKAYRERGGEWWREEAINRERERERERGRERETTCL